MYIANYAHTQMAGWHNVYMIYIIQSTTEYKSNRDAMEIMYNYIDFKVFVYFKNITLKTFWLKVRYMQMGTLKYIQYFAKNLCKKHFTHEHSNGS